MTEKTTQERFSLKSLAVLYVEDHEDVRHQLAEMLRRRVGKLHVAADGREGLEMFEAHRPDVVITDILMPVMDGLEMAEAIRARSEDTPIIVTTAFNELDYFHKAIEIGVDKYVSKPVDIEQLVAVVHRSAKHLFQRREIEAHNAFVRFILDANPNFVVVLDRQYALEYVNRTFLDFLGVDTLDTLKNRHRCLDAFIAGFNGGPSPAVEGKHWAGAVIEQPERQHLMHLRNPRDGSLHAYVVACLHFGELDKYVFSFTDVTRIEHEKALLAESAMRDPLTGIYNREKFDEALAQEVARARRYGTPLSLVMFDIDHFKQINDTHGHQAGDGVLMGLANLVGNSIREQDVFARWGGEEFMILAPSTDLEGAAQQAEKLRRLVAAECFPVVGQVTVSFGAAQLHPDDSVHSFTKRVDDALYQAKRGGRNRLVTAAYALF